jgi:hypothetical protein
MRKYERLTNLWTSMLSSKEELSLWHSRSCLLGECPRCRVDFLNLCPSELNTDQVVQWQSIGYEVVGQYPNEQEKKVPRIKYNESNPTELVDYLKPKLQSFIKHNYVAHWQDNQFKELMYFIPNGTVISCIDFSENYSLKVQNEIQSMHWYNFQITILVHITYRINPDWSCENAQPLILKKMHYYVSDMLMHDSLLVQHCMSLHWNFLKERGVTPTTHIVWSDGCSGQFKSARAWYFIFRYPNLTASALQPQECQMIWNYFATGHGKGEVDGAGALLKREVRKEQIKPDGRKLQNASEIVQFLREQTNVQHAGPTQSRKIVNRYI